MVTYLKWLVVLLLTVILPAAGQNNKDKPDDGKRCVRWGWSGDVYERKVYCLEWVKKDCSQRLHKEICKQE
jgi:hypothetical protein